MTGPSSGTAADDQLKRYQRAELDWYPLILTLIDKIVGGGQVLLGRDFILRAWHVQEKL